MFADYLGVKKVIWLGNGIAGDDTHGHVDDLARFVHAQTVVTVVEKDSTVGEAARARPTYELAATTRRQRDAGWALMRGRTQHDRRLQRGDGQTLIVDGHAAYAQSGISEHAAMRRKARRGRVRYGAWHRCFHMMPRKCSISSARFAARSG